MGYWNFNSKELYFEIEINDGCLELFLDYLYHRFRILYSKHRTFHIPNLWYFKNKKLSLKFQDGLELYPCSLDEIKIKIQNGDLNEENLINTFKVFAEYHLQKIFGLSQFLPINNKWIAPPSFFLRSNLNHKEDEFCKKDITFLNNYVSCFLDKSKVRVDKEKITIIKNLKDLINKNEYLDIIKLIKKNIIEDKPSFLDVLTESEFFSKIRQIYRYRKISSDEELFNRKLNKSEEILEIDIYFKDPHFGKIHRPSVQELWDELMDNSHITKTLIYSDFESPPNPLKIVRDNFNNIEWINVHPDQQIILIKNHGRPIPRRGYLYVYEYGDVDQIQKKRKFINFVKNHPLLENILNSIPNESLIDFQNKYNRKDLVNVISNNWGLFAVQGPPGTGKTYLATEVVVNFLKNNPYSKILICSKEHLALNYILKRITEALKQTKIDYRAFRSLSYHKQISSSIDPQIEEYLSSNIMKEIGSYSWNYDSFIWYHAQESLIQQYDLRNLSLALNSATIIFCTTMDSIFNQLVNKKSFDLVVIEEAGKCYSSELLHAICLGQKVLLIGDQNQLPPFQIKDTEEALDIWESTIKKTQNDPKLHENLQKRFGYDYKKLKNFYQEKKSFNKQSLCWLKPFETILKSLPPEKKFILENQYRMELPLSNLIGIVFYNREFKHKKKSINVLEGVIPKEYDVPLLWIDTPHLTEYMEATEDPEKVGLRVNFYELSILISYLKILNPIKKIDLVILTPYNDQKDLFLESNELRNLCDKLSEKPFQEIIRTTDEYQGHEADLTILSLVRNNTLYAASSWGFIIESERLNVMFSRTKLRQVILGCSQHIIRNCHEEKIKIFHKLLLEYEKEGRFVSSKKFLELNAKNKPEEE